MENKSLTILDKMPQNLAAVMEAISEVNAPVTNISDAIITYRPDFAMMAAIAEEAHQAIEQLIITDQDGLDFTATAVKAANEKIHIVQESREGIVRPLKNLGIEMSRCFDGVIEQLEKIKVTGKNKISEFNKAETARRREAEIKEAAEANAKALEDRRKILKVALIDAITGDNVQSANLSETIDRLVEAALYDNRVDHSTENGLISFIEQCKASIKRRAKKEGAVVDIKINEQAASNILSEHQSISIPAIRRPEFSIPKVNIRKTYRFKYADKDGKPSDTPCLDLIPKEYLMVNEQAIGGVARATKGTAKIPGIIFYSE